MMDEDIFDLTEIVFAIWQMREFSNGYPLKNEKKNAVFRHFWSSVF